MRYFKKYFFLFFLLFLFSSVRSEPEIKDSASAYIYWSQRGIIESIYAFMQDYRDIVKDALSVNEKNGIKKYEDRFIKEIDKKDAKQISDDYTAVPDFLLINEWKSTKTKLYDELKKQFDKKINLDSLFFVTNYTFVNSAGNNETASSLSIPGKTGFSLINWYKRVDDIIASYNKSLSSFAIKTKSNKDSTSKSDSSSNKRNNHNGSVYEDSFLGLSSNGILILFCIFLIGFLIGFFLIFYYTNRKVHSILKDERNKYLYEINLDSDNYSSLFKYISIIKLLKNKKDSYKKDFEKLTKENAELLQDKAKLNNQIHKLEKEKNYLIDNNDEALINVEKNNVTINQESIASPSSKCILYFGIPENDGSFIISKGENTNDGRKFYRIEFNKDESIGQLSFLSSILDKRAIERLDSFLKPVCKIINHDALSSASKIEFISPGTVVKIDNVWAIDKDKKVEIKLI